MAMKKQPEMLKEEMRKIMKKLKSRKSPVQTTSAEKGGETMMHAICNQASARLNDFIIYTFPQVKVHRGHASKILARFVKNESLSLSEME
jgi:hypothetical protein